MRNLRIRQSHLVKQRLPLLCQFPLLPTLHWSSVRPPGGRRCPHDVSFHLVDLVKAAFWAKQRLPSELCGVIEAVRLVMDTIQTTLRGDIRDLRRHSVSPADMQTIFAHFV